MTSDDTAIPDNDSVFECTPSDPEHENDDDEAEVTARGTALLADTNDNLNVVDTRESSVQYGAIESGDEAEKDDVETGEYESDDTADEHYVTDYVVDDPEETEAEVAAEVQFGEDVLESFGGEDQVLTGSPKGDS